MTSAAKHTAGPWTFATCSGPEAGRSAHIYAGVNTIVSWPRWSPDMYGNARLIAAAPELLAFAKWVADRGGDNNCMDIFKRARSVIAKAEGGAA